MDLGLLNYINVDLKWNIVKKGRRSVTRRPRKPGADSFGTDFDAKKSGTDVLGGHFAEKVVDAPLKKRRLLHQSLSPAPKTPCLNGERDLSPEPQTPLVHHEDSSQRCHSNPLSLTRKAKSKSGSRNSNKLKQMKKEVSNVDDFSGIELLAAAACSSFLHDDKDHFQDFSVLKEQTTPRVHSSCSDDKKEAITSTAGSLNQDMVPDTPILHDNNGNEKEQKKVVSSKGLRLHWDLNTVMDDWEEPSNSCSEGCEGRFTEVEPHSPKLSEKLDAAFSVVPVIEKGNGDSCGKTYELIEDLGCLGTKITSKISDGESSVSKSDVVDSLTHSDTSTTSVLREQAIVKCESDTIDNHSDYSNHENTISKSDQQPVSPKLCTSYSDKKVASEDPLSECCGSDVTQDEQGHMAEGDTMDKVEVGYDSPFEDGELREPIGWEENQVVDYGTIENSLPEKTKVSCEHDQAMEDQHSSLVKEAVHKNGIERPHNLFEESDCGKEISGRKNGDSETRPIRESTSVDRYRSGAYIPRSRSSNIGDSYNSRSGRDLGSCNFDLKSGHEYHRSRNITGGRSLDSHQFRTYDPRGAYRKPSPSERNNSYRVSREPPPVRSISRDSDRYRCGPTFHPHGFRRAPEEEYHERKPRCFSPNFNRPMRRSRSRSRSGSPIAWHFQKRSNLDSDDNKRQVAAVGTTRDQRCESVGNPERLKSDDEFQFGQRTGGPVREYKYKENGRKYDGGGVRRFRYSHVNNTDEFRYSHVNNNDESFGSWHRRDLDRDGRSSCLKEVAGGGLVTGEEKGVSSVSRFSS